MLYPLIAAIGSESYPRIPTFAVPCPTTIVTLGFLMMVDRNRAWIVSVIPILWAIVAGSAAWTLDMGADHGAALSALAPASQMAFAARRPAPTTP